jgi:hypothetical protein
MTALDVQLRENPIDGNEETTGTIAAKNSLGGRKSANTIQHLLTLRWYYLTGTTMLLDAVNIKGTTHRVQE